MSPSDPMHVTISVLPVSLALVHIPRSRLPDFVHPIFKQLLKPNPVFLNVTCNEIELSLFGEWEMGREFASVARKERRRGKGREVVVEAVEVSDERWSVLQIDSHSDRLDNSGARVQDLSRPLASAGISILYQSSYTSDFLLVKSFRINAVMQLLGSAGFDLYSDDAEKLISGMSPIINPVSYQEIDDKDADQFTESRRSSLRMGMSMERIRSGNGAVLTRTRSSTDASLSSLRSMNSLMESQSRPSATTPHTPAVSPALSPINLLSPDPMPLVISPPLPSRTSSHSPSSTQVQILDSDLTCVGLAEDAADVWTLKIVKLVAYPELIPGISCQSSRSAPTTASSQVERLSGPMPGFEPSLSPSNSPPASPSSYSTSEEDDDDSYFRTSPRARNHSVSESSIASSVSACSEDEADDHTPSLPSDAAADSKPELQHLETSSPLLDAISTPHPPFSPLPLSPTTATNLLADARKLGFVPGIPFFSFTRTQESSSLTTDVNVLAKLFPPNERHMVICSGELDVADLPTPTPFTPEEDEEGTEGPVEDSEDLDSDYEDQAGEEQFPSPSSLLKCLQVDLRKYGLEKHGLVNRFSKMLEENGVNHMYSSTFMSANLLVDKRNAKRAQALLRSC